MRRLTLCTVLAALGAAACAPPRSVAPWSVPLPDRIRVGTSEGVEIVPLEDYVVASTLAEVSPVADRPEVVARIFEIQSVMARTYAAGKVGRHAAQGFDLCDTTHCQRFDPARLRTSRFAAAARAAASRTRGQVLTFGGHVAEALFHSDCGGSTAAADAVWGGRAVPYLVARPDDVPDLAHRVWRQTIASDRLRAALNADPRTRVGRRLSRIAVRAWDASGRAARVSIAGERAVEISGADFRAIVNAALGDRTILSTRLSVSRTGESFVVAGTGFGHGVGLCQTGAAARARRGDPLQSIVQTYFRGVRLTGALTGPAAPPPPAGISAIEDGAGVARDRRE
jgi:stage II sporulation protein D